MGGPLAASLYRAGRSGAAGNLRRRRCSDGAGRGEPFGADWPISEGLPGYAGLFGDPATGLWHAAARWLDPTAAQFTTPDTWFGEMLAPGRGPMAAMLTALPGGAAPALTPVQSYAWCAYDPANFTDPTGHNWLGLIFTSISSLLWEMQLTSLSLQMYIINILLDILQVFPVFRPAWDSDGYWNVSTWNLPAPVASYRLMVPYALLLNGLLNVQDAAWTLGNVIWRAARKCAIWRARARAICCWCRRGHIPVRHSGGRHR